MQIAMEPTFDAWQLALKHVKCQLFEGRETSGCFITMKCSLMIYIVEEEAGFWADSSKQLNVNSTSHPELSKTFQNHLNPQKPSTPL